MIVLLLIVATAALLAWRFAAEAHVAGLVAPRRHALVASAVATGAVLVAMTELLSAVGLVTWGGIAAGWTCTLLVAAVVARRAPARVATPIRVDALVATAVAAMALVAATTALIAWAAPPNNWDSMTYHMSRVVQWQAQGSVAHYPTHISRQIYLTPGAEMALLHLQIGWGGDRLANLLQWAAFVGVMAGASLLAARLGAAPRTQAVAALFCATAPMAILESSSTQNDLVGAFWLLAFVYFAGLWRDRPSTSVTIAVGASLGLALVTKVTLYVIALPWLAVLALRALRAGRPGVRALLVVAAIAAALDVGHYARQAWLWWRIEPPAAAARAPSDQARRSGTAGLGVTDLVEAARAHAPAGGGMLRYVNAAMSPALLVSNVVRNVGLHAAAPWAPARTALDRIVQAAHDVLGVSLIDARTTYPSGRAFRAPEPSRHEDVAPNPLQLVLALWTAGVLLLRRRWDDTARAGALVACAFVLFAAVFKWQPWHARLHLPLLVVAAPVVATTLVEHASRRRAWALGVVLVLASTPWVVANETRPLVGPASVLAVPRAEQLFAGRPNLREPYLHAAAWLRERDCREIGLVIGGNEWEYPLWTLLGDAGRDVRIRHVNVANESRFAAPSDPPTAPCAVLAIGVADTSDEIVVDGRAYRRGFLDGPVRGFAP